MRKEIGVKIEKKAALYARVSITQQEQEATIESQVTELESYAQEQGDEIDPDLIFLDQTVSESRLARPVLPLLQSAMPSILKYLTLAVSISVASLLIISLYRRVAALIKIRRDQSLRQFVEIS